MPRVLEPLSTLAGTGGQFISEATVRKNRSESDFRVPLYARYLVIS